jgi:hypothetical protein
VITRMSLAITGRTAILLAALACCCPAGVEAQRSRDRELRAAPDAAGVYVQVQAAHGVRLSIPRNWQVLGEDARTTVAASALGIMSREGIHDAVNRMSFGANYHLGTPPRTAAQMNILFYEADVTQPDVAMIDRAFIAEFDQEMQANMRRSIEAAGGRIVAWKSTERVRVGGMIALLYGYERTRPAGEGTFHSRMLRVLDGPRSFTVTVGWASSHATLMEPITNYILSSVARER